MRQPLWYDHYFIALYMLSIASLTASAAFISLRRTLRCVGIPVQPRHAAAPSAAPTSSHIPMPEEDFLLLLYIFILLLFKPFLIGFGKNIYGHSLGFL